MRGNTFNLIPAKQLRRHLISDKVTTLHISIMMVYIAAIYSHIISPRFFRLIMPFCLIGESGN